MAAPVLGGGNAVLATFNIGVGDAHHATNAVHAALAIQEFVSTRTFSGVALRTRVGLNTGDVVAGSIGGSDRLSYTVHGDAVNLAARLKQLNKELGTSVLVGDSTVRAADRKFDFDAVATVSIRGKMAPVNVFRVTP